MLAVAEANKGSTIAATVGFSLTYALELPSVLMWLTRNTAGVETTMVSAERMMAIIDLPLEDAQTSLADRSKAALRLN